MTASVRSEDKAQQLLTSHPAWKDKVSFGFVSDLRALNAFDKLFDKPYDFILHTASPVTFKVNDVQADLIDPAIQGCVSSCLPRWFSQPQLITLGRTLGLLESAQKLGGSRLKRFVLLGSAVAVLNSFEEEGVTGRDYTEEDWNPVRPSYILCPNDQWLSLDTGNG